MKPTNTADHCHWPRSSSITEIVWWSQSTLQIIVTDSEAAASLNLCGEANQHCRSLSLIQKQHHWICAVKPINTADHCHWFRSSSLIESVWWSQLTLQITVTDSEAAASLNLCGEANQHCRSLSLSQKQQHHWIRVVKPTNTSDHHYWLSNSITKIELLLTSKIIVNMSLTRFCHDMSTCCSVDQSPLSSCQPTLQITVTDSEAASSLNLYGEANQHWRSLSLIQMQHHHWICMVKPTNTADHCHWFRSSSVTESVWWSQPTVQHCRSLSLIQKQQHHWNCVMKPTNTADHCHWFRRSVWWSQPTLQITVTDSEAAASLNLCGEANQHCRSLSLSQKQHHHWICMVKPTNTADHCHWFRSSSITESVWWSQPTLQITVTDSEAAASLNLCGEANQHCRSLSLIQTQQHHWICVVKPTNIADHRHWFRSSSITESVWWSQSTLQITVTDSKAASLNLCGEANQHCRSLSLIQKQHHHWICVVKPTNTSDHCHWFRSSSIIESVWWSQPTLQITVTDSEAAASLNQYGEVNQHCRSLSLIQKQHHWICAVKLINTADHWHWFRSSSVTESVWWSQPTLQITVADSEAASLNLCGEANQHCRSLSLIQKQQPHWICVVKSTNTADHCHWSRSSITESVWWSQSILQIIVTDSEAAASLNLCGEVNQHCRSLSLSQKQQHHWIRVVKPTNTSDHHYWLSNSITKIELLLTSKIIVNMSLTRFCHDMSTCCSVDQSPLSSCQQVNLCVDLSLTRYCRDMPTLSSSDQSTIIICENYIGSYCWDMHLTCRTYNLNNFAGPWACMAFKVFADTGSLLLIHRHHHQHCRFPISWLRNSFITKSVWWSQPTWLLVSSWHSWVAVKRKVHGANMGPTWVLSAPDGPHAGPWTLSCRQETLKLFHCGIMWVPKLPRIE